MSFSFEPMTFMQNHYTPDITTLAGKVTTMEFLQTLNDGICMLTMCSGASDGWISVSTKESHALWTDTMASRTTGSLERHPYTVSGSASQATT